MNQEIIQIAVLAAYGKANLSGKKLPLYKNNPGAYNYRNIQFISREPSSDQLLAKDIIAKDPNKWYDYLITNKISRLFLAYNPASKLTLEINYKRLFPEKGDAWYIFTEKNGKFDAWKSKWQAEQGDVKSYYYLFVKDMLIEKEHFPSLETSIHYFKAILSDLIDFTNRNKLNNWKKVFQNALAIFSITDPSELIDEELLPKDCYSLEAKQLIAACDQAWVFGGMGSWNDVVHVDDYDLYQRLTANLYDTLCHSISAAINSYP